MVSSSELERPTFEVNDSSLFRLVKLREGIDEHPEAYLIALGFICWGAEEGPKVIPEILDDPVANAMTRLNEFFDKRDDMKMEYDQATQDSLIADDGYQKLQSKFRSFVPKTRRGSRHTEPVVNPQATIVRDQIRRYTLGHYMVQVMDWGDRNKSESNQTLRSAS